MTHKKTTEGYLTDEEVVKKLMDAVRALRPYMNESNKYFIRKSSALPQASPYVGAWLFIESLGNRQAYYAELLNKFLRNGRRG